MMIANLRGLKALFIKFHKFKAFDICRLTLNSVSFKEY